VTDNSFRQLDCDSLEVSASYSWEPTCSPTKEDIDLSGANPNHH